MDRPIRVALMGDRPLFSTAMADILGAQAGIKVVADIGLDGDVDGLQRAAPDIVLIHFGTAVPPLETVKAIISRLAAFNTTKTVVVVPKALSISVNRIRKANATAFVEDETLFTSASAIIHAVMDGYVCYPAAPDDPLPTLSESDLRVFLGLARGMSVKDMAKTMDVSVSTIRTRKSNVMRALGCTDVIELIELAEALYCD
ncbi:LuxR C-terminal-related transcriptional regulator [Uliginosibacterium sp. sgz301328]|uniref:helix-turn-helix transcriptional regulator n=1 Tax=Uliginosibacterium sp. sgz301328 TaxID=3243764 RepID=UPI00359CF1CC